MSEMAWLEVLKEQVAGLDHWVQVMLKLIGGLVAFFILLIVIAYIRMGIAKIRGKPLKRPPAADWELMRRERGKKPKWDEWDQDH
ncbi:MAG: hypothetical protein CL992_04440 [Euryarchaeota archaeon]|jgi:type IV secretory pathway VirB2 component (pilin)|nr:hypothetical protein [Euryarchaeota archaeon]